MLNFKRKILIKFSKKDTLIFTLVTVFFLVGVVYGVLCSVHDGKVSVGTVIPDTKTELLKLSYFNNLRIVAWITLFAFSAVGQPVILYIDYLKGYSIGNAVSVIFSASQGNIFATIATFVPYLICTVTGIVLISKCSIDFSGYILGLLLNNKTRKDENKLIKFTVFFLISAFIMLLSAFSELLIAQNFT